MFIFLQIIPRIVLFAFKHYWSQISEYHWPSSISDHSRLSGQSSTRYYMMNITMNVTQFMLDDIEFIKALQHHEKMFLTFSYYSGFIISTYNFIIFVLAVIFYAQVSGQHVKRSVLPIKVPTKCYIFLPAFDKTSFPDVCGKLGPDRHNFAFQYKPHHSNHRSQIQLHLRSCG